MRLIRNPHGHQFTSSMQLGKIDCIAPVGLDPVTEPSRDQRWRNDNASVPGCRQLPLDPVAARSGLITEPQFAATKSQFCRRCFQGHRRVRNLTILAHFSPLTCIREGDRNRILVDVQTNVSDRLVRPYVAAATT
jgi:hypothetical protein